MVDFVVLPFDVDEEIGTSTFVVRRVAIGGGGLRGDGSLKVLCPTLGFYWEDQGQTMEMCNDDTRYKRT
jgi:hypothetical protein